MVEREEETVVIIQVLLGEREVKGLKGREEGTDGVLEENEDARGGEVERGREGGREGKGCWEKMKMQGEVGIGKGRKGGKEGDV